MRQTERLHEALCRSWEVHWCWQPAMEENQLVTRLFVRHTCETSAVFFFAAELVFVAGVFLAAVLVTVLLLVLATEAAGVLVAAVFVTDVVAVFLAATVEDPLLVQKGICICICFKKSLAIEKNCLLIKKCNFR